MISLRNCCYAAIRYEIMKVVPLFLVGARASLTARTPKSGAMSSQTNKKQFREIGLICTAHWAIQGPMGLIISYFSFKKGSLGLS